MEIEWLRETIKKAHSNAQNKGFYDCPECSERLQEKKRLGAGCHDEIGCETCSDTGKDPNKNMGELLMLIVSELGEALEAHRCSRFSDWVRHDNYLIRQEKAGTRTHLSFSIAFNKYIKDTFEDEIADVFIRLCDFCGYYQIVIDDCVLSSHPTIVENVGTNLLGITFEISRISQADDCFSLNENISFLFAYIHDFCSYYKINLEKHVEAKMAYNRTRPAKHGKEY